MQLGLAIALIVAKAYCLRKSLESTAGEETGVFVKPLFAPGLYAWGRVPGEIFTGKSMINYIHI